jgi:stage II sporulation protein D
LIAISALALALAPAAAAKVFIIEGRGWGHGLGMSQWGAEGFAEHGTGYRAILAHYYPGTRLARMPNRTMRVLLAERRDRLLISSRAPFAVFRGGRKRVLRAGRYAIPSRRLQPPLRFEPGAQPLSLDGRLYRGAIAFTGRGGSLVAVNYVRLERYLRGVVPAEMPFRWRPAALQAQAVAARSYALSQLKPSQSFDLYADTRDQVYGGIATERPSTNHAVGATAGQVLTWNGRPALAYYCSTSGGRTAAGSLPYLASVPDPFDSISPHHLWGPLRFGSGRVAKRLHVPGVRDLSLALDGSGRVASVLVIWQGGRARIPVSQFESDLGLLSNWFRISGTIASHSTSSPVRAAWSGDWPAGRTGYTVVLVSVPASSGLASARAAAAKARHAGLPQVGVLVSSRFATLHPGYYVVFSGFYGRGARAQAAARAAASRYPAAYPRRIA